MMMRCFRALHRQALNVAETQAMLQHVLAVYSRPGSPRARSSGLMWLFTGFFASHHQGLLSLMDAAVANVRRYGGDWEPGVLLTFRTHC